MNLVKFLAIVIVFYFSFVNASQSCTNNSQEIREKIDYLKTQVICSNSSSLEDCFELLSVSETSSNDIEFNITPPEESCSESGIYAKAPTSLLLAGQYENLQAVAKKLQERVYVNDALDFHEHMSKHKKRIVDLGLKVYDEYPNRFSGITRWELKTVLEAHDNAKVTASSKHNGRPFYKVLFEEGYGKKMDREIVDSLNSVDERWTQNAFKKVGLSTEGLTGDRLREVIRKRNQILKIEKIADFVDRGMSPVSEEEFGRKMAKASESRFFLKSKKDRRVARFLEKNYDEIIKGHEYRPLSSIQKARLESRLLIQERFASLIPSATAKASISSRAIASQIVNKAKKGLGIGARILASARFLKGLNAAELSLYSRSTACTTLGYHDWIKDPNCKPLLALSPKVISFLDEKWPVQKSSLESGEHMCHVVESIYNDLQTDRFNEIACSDNDVDISSMAGKDLKLEKSGSGDIKAITFSSNGKQQGRSLPTYVRSVGLNDNGEVDEVCFERRVSARSREVKKNCFSQEDSSLDDLNYHQKSLFVKAKNFVQTNSFDISRATLCCNGSPKDEHLQMFCSN